MKQVLRPAMKSIPGVLGGVAALIAAVIVLAQQGGGTARQIAQATLTTEQQHGRDIWFNSTFGGERFFSLILPQSLSGPDRK